MSLIRSTESGRYSNIVDGLYVFLRDGDMIESYGRLHEREVFVEIMFRVMERADVEFSEEDVKNVREFMELNDLKTGEPL